MCVKIRWSWRHSVYGSEEPCWAGDRCVYGVCMLWKTSWCRSHSCGLLCYYRELYGSLVSYLKDGSHTFSQQEPLNWHKLNQDPNLISFCPGCDKSSFTYFITKSVWNPFQKNSHLFCHCENELFPFLLGTPWNYLKDSQTSLNPTKEGLLQSVKQIKHPAFTKMLTISWP